MPRPGRVAIRNCWKNESEVEDMETKKDILIGCLCAIGCELLFGFSYVFTKGTTGAASAFALLGWRFSVAIVAMSVCAAVGFLKIRPRCKNLWPLLVVALFSPVIYFIGETFGISLTTASESGAFLACIPVASVIASTLILKKRPTAQQIIGITVTFVGVMIAVFAVGSSASFSVAGYAMLCVAVISYALYSVFVEKSIACSGAEVTFVMLAAGAIVFSAAAVIEALAKGNLVSLVMLPFRDKGFLIAIFYQGIGCSVLAFFLSNVAIFKIGVNRTSSFIGVATMVSIVAGTLILHEHFSVWQMIGTLIIIYGVYIANAKKHEG